MFIQKKVSKMDFRHGTGIASDKDLMFMSWGKNIFNNKPFFVLKYFPDKKGERELEGQRFSKVKPPLYAYNEMIDTAEEFDESLVSYSELLKRDILDLESSEIEVFDPVEKAGEMVKNPSDKVEKQFREMREFFSGIIEEENLDLEIGVTASLLFGLHDPESSDIDLVFYGSKKELERLQTRIKKLVDEEVLKLDLSSFEKQVVEETMNEEFSDDLKKRIVEEKRYLSSFEHEKADTEIHLQYVDTEPLNDIGGGEGVGRKKIVGKVTKKSSANYVCPEFTVSNKEGDFEVICYHKSGSLIKQGDEVSLEGYMIEKQGKKFMVLLDEKADHLKLVGDN